MASDEAGPVRRVLRFLRHQPDRLLHPIRRRRLRRRLEALARRPGEILFVCHGNVCRSPYAELAFPRVIPAEARYDPTLRSAGFVGPGRSPPDTAIRVARRRGVELAAHRSSILTVAKVRRSELIVVMNADQRRDVSTLYGAAVQGSAIVILGDLDPERPRRRGIPDPYRGDDDAFAEAYAQIDRCLHELWAALGVIATEEVPGPAASLPPSPGPILPAAR